MTLQALFGGDPPLEAYPTKDRDRIRELQDRLAAEREERLKSAQSRA